MTTLDAAARPPPARITPVRETYFGVTVEDPYRWMEDWKAAEAQAWLTAQAAYARRVLDALPTRTALLTRITALSAASPILTGVHVAGSRTFYLRRDPGDNLAKLVVRDGWDAGERVLLDPNHLPGPPHVSLDWYAPSRDGRYVAYGLSPGGSEDSVLHVLKTATGTVLDLAITRTQWGAVSWLEDHQSFVYLRFPARPPDAPPTERYLDGHIHLHRLGRDPERDPVVFGRGVQRGVEVAREDFPVVACSPISPWLLGVVAHGVQNELTLYTAPRAALTRPAPIPWRKVADPDDGVTDGDLTGDTLLLRSHRGAPRFQVVATSAARPALAHATVLVPEGRTVIQGIRVAGPVLLTRELDGAITRLRAVPLKGGPPRAVPLPFDGTISDWGGDPASPDVLLEMTSWTVSPRVLRLHALRHTVTDTGWLPPSPVESRDVVSQEVLVPSADGTPIPLSIIHGRELRLNGEHPAWLTGYGSYGLSLDAAFAPAMLAWYERGGVHAVAHVRGGGECGKAWHDAGRRLNKRRTIEDFIACAEFLIAQGYTRPARLAGSGTSAGGITAGGALVTRPDLWRAMLLRVADTNALRSEFMESGPANVPEFGSVATAEGFQALHLVDAYAHVATGTPYPAVLLTTGVNDPRVAPWQAMKMAARLQAATASDRPVVLRVDFGAGHGLGSTKQQRDEELADLMAFLLWQCAGL